jgi:hypothetical protein
MKFALVFVLVLVLIFQGTTFGQKKESAQAPAQIGLSKDMIEKYKPKPLTTNIISGELLDKNSGRYHYYSFVAGRGDITLEVSLESSSPASTNGIKFDLWDSNDQIIDFGVAMSLQRMPFRKETRIFISKRQSVLLRITEGVNIGPGRYRIQVGGAVEISPDGSTLQDENLDPLVSAKQTSQRTPVDPLVTTTQTSTRKPVDPLVTATQESTSLNNKTNNLEKCLPRGGTLIIKMKDGSKKIIDLNEAETITVVP